MTIAKAEWLVAFDGRHPDKIAKLVLRNLNGYQHLDSFKEDDLLSLTEAINAILILGRDKKIVPLDRPRIKA
tara:strand:- start:1137 stop:1352 length:216 start_codon:yes stop_codon:yes gene_type:complete